MRIRKTSQYIEGGVTIETGSNTNGNYIKYSDGTLICSKVVTGTADITNANGALYSSTDIDLGVYPMAFISRPVVNITPTKSDSFAYQYFMMTGETVVSNNLTNAPYITLLRTSSRQNVAYRIEVIAIGKWK